MKYKVKALSVGGLKNKIFNSGEIVTDKDFPDGEAEKKVESGYLERIKEDVAATAPSSEKQSKKTKQE